MTTTSKNMSNLITPRGQKATAAAAKVSDKTEPKQMIFRASKAASHQLALLALEVENSQQGLLIEALNDLFVKYNKNPIA